MHHHYKEPLIHILSKATKRSGFIHWSTLVVQSTVRKEWDALFASFIQLLPHF